MRNGHTSPFEQVNFTFHLKMPIFVARQWIRHRTGRVNEISGRYSVMTDECYRPDREHINPQSEVNRQGRTDIVLDQAKQDEVLAKFKKDHQVIFDNYHSMLDDGIARELARIDLPLSMYTEWYWQMDLRNLFHFLSLRLDSHAQYEIRVYAEQMLEIVKKVCPIASEAFEEFEYGAMSFSKSERAALHAMLKGEENPLKGRSKELFEAKLRQD